MRKCGNCDQVGHNRRTCRKTGSFQPVLRRKPVAVVNPVVNTRYLCPGINGIGSHIVHVLEGDTTLSFIMDKQASRGGGGYFCPKHNCPMTLA